MSFLEFALESSLLVVIVMGIRRIFTGRIQYAAIYALWLLVFLRFLIPVNFVATPLSIGRIIPESLFERERESRGTEIAVPVRTAERETAEDKASGGRESEMLSGIRPEERSKECLIGGREDWPAALACGWAAVSGILFLWLLASNGRLLKKMKRDSIVIGVRGKVRIYASSAVKEPCLYGFFRPAIYLPFSILGDGEISGEEREQIVTHEYVHYRHGDHIWSLLRMILLAAYWFDPFMWLAVSCSKKDAELFCDETVIGLLGENKRFSYGRMLVRMAGEASRGEFFCPVMPVSRRGREMKKRIRAIARRKKYSRLAAVSMALVVLAAAVVTCSSRISPPAEAQSAGPENEAATSKSVSLPSAEEEAPVEEELFGRYIEVFTGAVNTGDTDGLSEVLYEDSAVYEQQSRIAENYYSRGIREKVKSVSIDAVHYTAPDRMEIVSRERIRVFYEDADSRLVRQSYIYGCEKIDGKWYITDMNENAAPQK